MVLEQSHIDYFKKRSDVELFKIIKSYFIDGVVASVNERFQIGDEITYAGRVTGMESQMLYNKIKSVQQSPNMFKENGIDPDARIENEVILFVSITKNEKGKYESNQKKMSAKSFLEICENVVRLAQTNAGKTVEELLQKYDEASEEYKSLKVFSDITGSDALFSFTLYRYESVLQGNATTVRSWSINDSNDKQLRAEYEVKTEFKLP